MKHRMGSGYLCLVGLCLAVLSATVKADSLVEQRKRYQQVREAFDAHQMVQVEQLLPTLKTYPLWPYLRYRLLAENLQNETSVAVKAFIQRYPTLPPAQSLSSRFVNELARRQDWKGLLAFRSQVPQPVAAQCNWYYAKWATGQQQVAWQGANALWLRGSALPKACDRLFSVWRAAGRQTPALTRARLLLAMKKGNAALVSQLARQLPADQQASADVLIALQNNPLMLERFARQQEPTGFSRQVTLLAFTRLARQDAENARSLILLLVRAQKMNGEESQQLKETAAWQMMGNDVTAEQARWRDNVVMDSQSVSLIERRVRLAIGMHDRRGLNTWLARLPPEAKEKQEWQYWQADLLIEQARREEAQALLRHLSQQRGFYPMVAAQRLGIDFPLRVQPAPRPTSLVTESEAIARVRELMYWHLDNLARSEWETLVASRPREQQQMLARFAQEQRFWDLSVQATIVGKLWDNLQQRFPLAFRDAFERYTSDKAITSSYAMAIARQESAFRPNARSPVGALGLMQLMPATAQHTARQAGLSGARLSEQLLMPQFNIQIGSAYLDEVYQQFDENRIFASAAYNAGPSRVRRWRSNSAGKLDAVAFIESIPFSETRSYVKNVLAYDAYYRYFMHKPHTLLTQREWQVRY